MSKDFLLIFSLIVVLGSAMHLQADRDYDVEAKERLVSDSDQFRADIPQGWYYLEYFHPSGSNDRITVNGGKLVTSGSNRVKIFIKKNYPNGRGESAYETLKQGNTNKWIKSTYYENSLVSNEGEATHFQVMQIGSHFVFKYPDPYNPRGTIQLGVEDRPRGSVLSLCKSAVQLFKLVNA